MLQVVSIDFNRQVHVRRTMRNSYEVHSRDKKTSERKVDEALKNHKRGHRRQEVLYIQNLYNSGISGINTVELIEIQKVCING